MRYGNKTRSGSQVSTWLPNPPPLPWVRPSDWLALPAITPGDQKFQGLFKVEEGDSNLVAFTVAGAYTVDWGDGSSPANFATGTTASRNIAWGDVSSGTLTSDGFRQVIITITPQSGSNLTSINTNVRHPSISYTYGSGWLDIEILGSNISSLTLRGGNVNDPVLQRVSYTGATALTSFANLFSTSMPRLASVALPDSGSVTSTQNMFLNCFSLRSVPLFNTASVTTMQAMFAGARSLETVPLFNTGSVTNMFQMFNTCPSLRSVPGFNVASVTNMGEMFVNCESLQTVEFTNTGSVTSMQSVFSGCRSLESVPLFNTASVTTMQTMFQTCVSLKTVPLFNTASVTTMQQMFDGCLTLESVPQFNTASVTTMPTMFRNCLALSTVPLFNTASVTTFNETFSGCSSLAYVPQFNTGNVTTMNAMFNTCTGLGYMPEFNIPKLTTYPSYASLTALQRIDMIPRRSLNISSCKLSSAELDRIYTRLPDLTARTVTNVTHAAGVVTYTTDVAHNYLPGMVITMSGIDPVAFNLSSQTIVDVPTTTSFTVTNAATGTYVSGGTATPASATLTVTNNWGAATDDPTIATNKAWSVSG
jgi:surface protein